MRDRLGLLMLVALVVYLAYRFWEMGTRLGGPLVGTGVCVALLVVGALGLWAVIRHERAGPS